MQIWRSLDEVPGDLGRTVVTVGNFDGVHLGHQHVVSPGPRGRRRDWACPSSRSPSTRTRWRCSAPSTRRRP